jgi:Ca2+-binding EF-hand superfamily protein
VNKDGAGTVVEGASDDSATEPLTALPPALTRRTVAHYDHTTDLIDAAVAARDHTLRAARTAAAALPDEEMSAASASRYLEEWSARAPRAVRALTDAAIGTLADDDDAAAAAARPSLARASSFSTALPDRAAPTLPKRSSSMVSRGDVSRFVSEAEALVRQSDWQLRAAFMRADRDGAGAVDGSELAAALLESGLESSGLMAALGASGERLSFDDFQRLVRELEDADDARRCVPALFALLDRSRAGALSGDDIAQLATPAALPLLRRCLPAATGRASRCDNVMSALRQLQGGRPVTLSVFERVMAAQLAAAREHESRARAEFRALADKAGKIDFEQFVGLLDLLTRDGAAAEQPQPPTVTGGGGASKRKRAEQ